MHRHLFNTLIILATLVIPISLFALGCTTSPVKNSPSHSPSASSRAGQGEMAGTPSDLLIVNGRLQAEAASDVVSVYFAIQNRSDRSRTIIGGRCSGCSDVEIRRAVFRKGAMTADVLPDWEIPARGMVAFAPRGLSLSLIGLPSLQSGETIHVELELADGERVGFDAAADAPTP